MCVFLQILSQTGFFFFFFLCILTQTVVRGGDSKKHDHRQLSQELHVEATDSYVETLL